MTSSLTGDYLRWLEPQIRDRHDGLSNPGREYWGVLEAMFNKEFVWLVANDDNRIGDGLDLRVEFCHEHGLRARRDRTVQDFLSRSRPYPCCSFLEVLIGLSRRLSFLAGGSAPRWAWMLMVNLGLHRMGDPFTRTKARRTNNILDQCIWRTYSSDGTGGFFPLEEPEEDQTKVEVWYQMAAYLAERP